MNRAKPLVAYATALLLAAMPLGCGTPVVKSKAFDGEVLREHLLPGALVEPIGGGEWEIGPDVGWMAGIDASAHLTFVGFRPRPGELRFCLVLACDPAKDALVLLPLRKGENPLSVLSRPERRKALRQEATAYSSGGGSKRSDILRLSLRGAIADGCLGSPLPKPQYIFAVAANFRSHLVHDLAVDDGKDIAAFGRTRARVFLKYPPVPPPGAPQDVPKALSGIIGPYDGIEYPATIALPPNEEGAPATETETRLDYEVEIGAVIGRRLTWQDAQHAPDSALRSAVAGYVLVSDTKARNPQVVDKVADQNRPYPEAPSPYLTGQESVDRAFGFWDEETCRWWSYAAGWGNYASIGPFFVAAPADVAFPARAMISARSYGPAATRGAPIPRGHAEGVFYLRQCAEATEDPADPRRTIWTVPQIIRAILAPDNALKPTEEPARLEPGDILCLGTPGGTVITSKPQRVLDLAGKLLFWWKPTDWHDAFFDKDTALYLRHGDEVFLWAEGLGYQRQPIRRIQAGR